MIETRRVAIAVTLACDGTCRFCAQVGLPREPANDDAIGRAIAQAGAAGHEVTFVGGEPTTRQGLPAWIAAAREAGAPAVGIQTHGRALVDATTTAALVGAGLTDVHLSIHGARAQVHDYHTDAPGSLGASLAGLATLRRLAPELSIVATTVVTRSNFRVLAELPPRLRAWGIAAWSMAWAQAAGAAALGFDRLVPRLGLAIPFALHAAAAARRLGLPTFFGGTPRCVLGPLAGAALAMPTASYAEVCGTCPAAPGCAGIDPHYHQRFGAAELHALDAAVDPRASATDHPALRRMFLGIGTHAPDTAPTIADSPDRARARLPVLGRPDPARQEVRGRPARGSGMRQLFPALFGDNDDDR